MDMAQDHEDACDTGLALGLGSGGRYTTKRPSQLPHHRRAEPCSSLTLSLSEEATYGPTTPKAEANHKASEEGSTVSSFSTAYPPSSVVKREKDGSDEDEEGSGRKKLRLTKEQSALLEDRFKEHSTLNPKQKQALAQQLNLRPRQVEVWFQNRRARTKLKQTEVDCEFLKRCCETLTDENRRLQKELKELKALKFAPPVYMQLPAATLTMCPSCDRIAGGAGNGSKGGGAAPFVVAQKPHFFNPFTHSAAC